MRRYVFVYMARIIIQIVEKKTADQRQIFDLAIENAPLSISHNVILRAASDTGKWTLRPEAAALEKQLISDSTHVDTTISRWCEKVREAANNGCATHLQFPLQLLH